MKSRTPIVVALLMAGSFGIGRWHDRAVKAGTPPSTGSRILYYHDPMHPSYRSDKPGKAPDCGMDLVAVYAPVNAGNAAPEAAPNGADAAAEAGAVRISAEKQQLIGVRVGVVEESSGTRKFRTLGRVLPDEARVYRLTSKVEGWVRKIYPVSTGTLVRKGQPLLAIYSKEFQVAQQAYLFSLNQLDRFNKGDEPDALDRLKLGLSEALVNLRNMGMSEDQIQEIAHTRKLLLEVNLGAPATGFLTARTVYDEQRFDRGMDFYKMVDISQVWILADLSGPEAGFIQPGTAARVSVPQLSGAAFEARVGQVLPQFDAVARTLQVRLEAANPGFVLKPDMYVDVEFAVPTPKALTVPRDAVIDSGLKKIVFVDRGNGGFQARQVRTGWRLGDTVEIVEGLKPGERIVVSGNFLIDSETRLQSTTAPMSPTTAPVALTTAPMSPVATTMSPTTAPTKPPPMAPPGGGR
jgi:Cu(I)/Ag(I) efflux system membrane fusion protein